ETDTTYDSTILNLVVAGDDEANRTGNKVLMKSISTKLVVYPGSSQTVDNAFLRAMIIYDKAPNGGFPTQANLLTPSSVFGRTPTYYYDRFTKIWDEMIPVGDVSKNTGPQVFNIYKKLSLESVYSGSAGTIADIQTGGLYFIVLGNTATGTNAAPVIEASHRLRFQK
uniref:hypothetical protein n=1 Tax=Aliarcobacter sp. TaxID=2321116 RepID=UPI0040474672